jgi:hypothetical protein
MARAAVSVVGHGKHTYSSRQVNRRVINHQSRIVTGGIALSYIADPYMRGAYTLAYRSESRVDAILKRNIRASLLR